MEFKIGDRVRIRQWEDMKKEFGTDLCGDIVMKGYWHFAKGMRHLCGREAVITEICDQRVELDFDNKTGDVDWSYTTDMVEKVEDTEMTKKDLENGMVCEVRCGKRYIWLYGDLRGINSWCSKTQEDLTNLRVPNLDIVKIYDRGDNNTIYKILQHPGKLIWERKEPKEMTVAEIEAALGYPVKVVK